MNHLFDSGALRLGNMAQHDVRGKGCELKTQMMRNETLNLVT